MTRWGTPEDKKTHRRTQCSGVKGGDSLEIQKLAAEFDYLHRIEHTEENLLLEANHKPLLPPALRKEKGGGELMK